jgi:hypothetical protein
MTPSAKAGMTAGRMETTTRGPGMTAKADALQALTAAEAILNDLNLTAALRLAQVRATLHYARLCVETIVEVKRVRRAKENTA